MDGAETSISSTDTETKHLLERTVSMCLDVSVDQFRARD